MKTNDETVVIYVTPDVKRQLAAIAEAQHRSLASVGRQAIIEWLGSRAVPEPGPHTQGETA